MRNAVDSSILLDVLLPDPKFGPASANLLRKAIDSGVLIACEIVWAEVRAAFSNDELFNEAMEKLGVQFEAFEEQHHATLAEAAEEFCSDRGLAEAFKNLGGRVSCRRLRAR